MSADPADRWGLTDDEVAPRWPHEDRRSVVGGLTPIRRAAYRGGGGELMPTGYTHRVQTGEVSDLRGFILCCARAFGACVEQRDDSLDVPPREQKPGRWHADRAKECRDRAAAILNQPMSAWRSDRLARHEAALREYVDSEQRRSDGSARYRAMIAKVEAWTPPTAEHAELKAFMLDQLRESLRFDYDYEHRPPKMPGLTEADQLAEAAEYLAEAARHEKEQSEEEERVARRNRWIRDLYAALPVEPVSRA